MSLATAKERLLPGILACATFVLIGCNRHDTGRAALAMQQIQADLRLGEFDQALSRARSGVKSWSDRVDSEAYVGFKNLEAEALLQKGQASTAYSLLTALRIPPRFSQLEVQRQTLVG